MNGDESIEYRLHKEYAGRMERAGERSRLAQEVRSQQQPTRKRNVQVSRRTIRIVVVAAILAVIILVGPQVALADGETGFAPPEWGEPDPVGFS